jgi:hypothetical protein
VFRGQKFLFPMSLNRKIRYGMIGGGRGAFDAAFDKKTQ